MRSTRDECVRRIERNDALMIELDRILMEIYVVVAYACDPKVTRHVIQLLNAAREDVFRWTLEAVDNESDTFSAVMLARRPVVEGMSYRERGVVE